MSSPLTWPDRFLARHRRAPRILHICNIANYAYVNATMMRRRGVDSMVLDPDLYHVCSTPEWLEADLHGDYGDDFYPDWRAARPSGFQRPEWYINGPTPFVYRELAARQRGKSNRGRFYASLSRLYRVGLASRRGEKSSFRRFMEGTDPISRTLKALAHLLLSPLPGRRLTSQRGMASNQTDWPLGALPRRVPVSVLRAALEPFDVIIGYTLGACVPAVLGMKRFISLELGTLRGLAFEESDLGRMCAWVYQSSPEIFLTNVDCVIAAEKLRIPMQRTTPIPHPFDVDLVPNFAPRMAPSPPGDATPYFFCPARHHWRDGNTSWLKGNHVLIRGAAQAAASAERFRLVMVDWGQEVELSRALIAELGLADRVTWIRPAHRRALWPIVCGAVAVLDQFAAPAFGGAGLETLALGRRVISRFEGVDLSGFFSSPPPILHAATPDEVANAIRRVLRDPDDTEGRGKAGQAWMQTQHSVERQMLLQFAVCERLVESHGVGLT